MKRTVLVFLSGFLVVGMVAAAHAQKLEFTATGRVEVSGVLTENLRSGMEGAIFGSYPSPYKAPGTGVTEANSGAFDKTNSYWGERFRIWFNAAMGKELSGTVGFEMDSARWGERGTGSANMGRWNADQVGVEIKNAYLDFALPYIGISVPTTVRVGVQPIGTRPWIFNTVDGAGITAAMKIDPLQINLVWGKALEGMDANSDDIDVYGLNTSVALGPISIGGYAFFYNMNTYPFDQVQTTYGTRPANRSEMWWLGAYADGKLGPLNFNFDFVLDTGKVEARTAVAQDVDYQGWATRAHVSYPREKFNFGLVGMYATGADARKTGATGLPGGTNQDVDSYVVPPGSEENTAFGESLVYYGSTRYTGSGFSAPGMYNTADASNQMTRGAIGGTWMLKAYSTFKATPWYSITFQGLYIGDTTDNGNTVGDAVKSDGTRRDDSDIGIELDLMNDIQIYKNLTWTVAGGILFAGDALDQRIGTTNTNKSPNNPWIIATKLTYAF